MTPNDSGYYLVDGARRRLALQKLGRGEAPCVIRESSEEVEQLIDAVTANAQRIGLSIVEEARAFQKMRSMGKPVKQIASELGVAQRLVGQRLAMLTLPDYVLKLIGDGGLQPGHIPTLVEMAKVSPNLATGVATKVVERKIAPAPFAAQPFAQVAQGHVRELDIWIVGVNQPTITVASVKKDLDELTTARLKEIGELAGTETPHAIALNQETVDAGIAFGCVYVPPVHDEPWGAKMAFCSKEWVVSAVAATINVVLEKAKAEHPASDDAAPQADEAAPAVTEEQAKEAKREERQADLKARLAANALNLNLGAELFTGLAEVKLTKESALLLARLVIRDDARSLYLAGVRFCDSRAVKEIEQKNGPAKLEYELVDRDDQGAQVWAFIERSDTGEQVLGRLFQVLGMASLCDQSTVAVSSRPGHAPIARDAREFVAATLGAKLPQPIRDRLDKDIEKQAKWDADEAARKAENDRQLRDSEDADQDEYLELEHEANFPQDDED